MNLSDVKVGMRVKLIAKEYPNGDTDGIFEFPKQISYEVLEIYFSTEKTDSWSPNGRVTLRVVDEEGANVDIRRVDPSMIEPYEEHSSILLTTFLNKSLTPFKDLTDEQKLLIIRESMKGNVQFLQTYDNKWYRGSDEVINQNHVYRIKPSVLDIPWQHIKPEYKWAAMDKSGLVFGYSNKPTIKGHFWESRDKLDSLNSLNIPTKGIQWDKSLTQRPDGV